MKIRYDFVTNSSSSNFVCDLCGRSASVDWIVYGEEIVGDEYSLIAIDRLFEEWFVRCKNGHIICINEVEIKDINKVLYELLRIKKKYLNTIENNHYKELINLYRYDLEDKLWIFDSLEKGESLYIDDSLKNDILTLFFVLYSQNMPEEFCPVCSLKQLNDNLLFKYLSKKYKVDREEVMNEIRRIFKNYKEFIKYINE